MEMQQNPNPYPYPYPNSNYGDPLSQTTNYSGGYSHNLNSDPYGPPAIDNALFLPHPQPQPWPPGVDPPYVPPQVAVNYVQQPPTIFEPQHVAAAAYYYPDPNVSWSTAISQIGATHYATDVTAPNISSRSQIRNILKQGLKKTKVVQSARCDVCKIDCNSRGVLEQHELGKKHQKNLHRLKLTTTAIPGPSVVATAPSIIAPLPAVVAPSSAAIGSSTFLPASALALAPIDKPLIGPVENPEKSKNAKARKKAAAARTENLETKRRKVLDGGATAQAVRACGICNVVCNSDTVFNYHLAGQRHASMVKKYTLNAAGVAPAL